MVLLVILEINCLFTVKGEVKPYIESLKIEEKDVPYFFVLDASGKIVHVEKGKYSEAKMDKIEEFIE